MPIPYADLTDDHIRRADLVHVVVPGVAWFDFWLPAPPDAYSPPGSGAATLRILEVLIDPARTGAQLTDIRRRVRAVLGPP